MYILGLFAWLGALQGAIVLLSILLRMRHPKNFPLGLLLVVFSLRLATIPTWNAAILLKSPWIYPVTAPLPFLFGPLLWWYARELSRESSGKPPLVHLHFLPWMIEVLLVVTTIVGTSPMEYSQFVLDVFSGNPPLWLLIRNGLKVILNIIYVTLAGRLAFGTESGRLSKGKRLWLRSFTVVPATVLGFFAYVAIAPGATARLAGGRATPFLILSVTMAVLIYSVSFLMIFAPEVSKIEKTSSRHLPGRVCTEDECVNLVRRLERRFAEGAFLDPDLTLADLASQLQVNPNRLSYAINQVYGRSFRTVLNHRRLDYFTNEVEANISRDKSILSLAFESGFPSKSTFNRVFRDRYGVNPTEYLTREKG